MRGRARRTEVASAEAGRLDRGNGGRPPARAVRPPARAVPPAAPAVRRRHRWRRPGRRATHGGTGGRGGNRPGSTAGAKDGRCRRAGPAVRPRDRRFVRHRRCGRRDRRFVRHRRDATAGHRRFDRHRRFGAPGRGGTAGSTGGGGGAAGGQHGGDRRFDRAPAARPETAGTGGGGVACTSASTCPGGADSECQHKTCINNVCGLDFTAANTPVFIQTHGRLPPQRLRRHRRPDGRDPRQRRARPTTATRVPRRPA